MKKSILYMCILTLISACSSDDYDIPKDANGNAILTEISSSTTTGISTLDANFTVSAKFPNAKEGDVMNVECLQLQDLNNTNQLLPLNGTQKTVTVGNDLTASVSYNRQEANLKNVGDYVTVTFSGKTDYAIQKVEMIAATEVSKPQSSGIDVSVARNDDVAYFNVTVKPANGTYNGTLVVKRKNGVNGEYVTVEGSPFSGEQPFMVPVKGSDFEAGKDTMYYSFVTEKDGYSEVIETSVVVIDPYFFFKRSSTLTKEDGLNMMTNVSVKADSEDAMIMLSADSKLQGGTSWLESGNTIEFVPATSALYEANKSNDAISAFNAGEKTTSVDPSAKDGVFIFKAVTGPNAEDVYYGIIRVKTVIPNESIVFEYRIGNMYSHLSAIK